MTTILFKAVFFLIWIACTPFSSWGGVCSNVSLKALDKTTGRVHDLKIPVGSTVSFGTLSITPRFCEQSADDVIPETTVFLEIREGENPDLLFSNWMFASNPGVCALEHPVYDVWVEPRGIY